MNKTLMTILFWLPVTVVLAGIIYSGYAFPIDPVSDFEIYWDSSTNLHEYIKGGGVLLIYAFFKYFGIAPTVAAVTVNASALLIFAWAVWPASIITLCNTSKEKKIIYIAFYLIATALVTAYGILLLPMAGFTEVMAIHTALLTMALKLIITSENNRRLYYLGILIGVFALTMRMQSVIITSGTTIGLNFFSLVFCRKILFKKACIALLFICIAAMGIETLLCAQSQNKFQIQFNQRLPLYTGSLIINPDQCGTFHDKARATTVREINIPLTVILKKYLSKKPISKIMGNINCKLNYLFNENHSIGSDWWRIYHYMVKRDFSHKKFAETIMAPYDVATLNFIKKILIALLVIIFIIGFKNKKVLFFELFILSFLLSYIITFMIFEANPRYLIPFYGLSIWLAIYTIEYSISHKGISVRGNSVILRISSV